MARWPGDWDCSSCNYTNWGHDSCRRCAKPRNQKRPEAPVLGRTVEGLERSRRNPKVFSGLLVESERWGFLPCGACSEWGCQWTDGAAACLLARAASRDRSLGKCLLWRGYTATEQFCPGRKRKLICCLRLAWSLGQKPSFSRILVR